MTRGMLSILAGWVLAAITFTAPPASLAADQGNVEAEQRLMKMERDWCSASVKGDAAAVGAILADDFTDVSLTGEVVDKVQVLADVKAEKGAVCNIDMMQIRVYGDAAVVVGRTTWISAAGNGQYRYTDIYVRRGGRWTCVASQATDIKK
jgi:ketosteroid isomerase-like protein